MAEQIIDELEKRLNAKGLHELRRLGRALGVPHSSAYKFGELVNEILTVAKGEKDLEPLSNRGAPPKSQQYDNMLASDILRCREVFLAKNLKEEKNASREIFVANSGNDSLDFIGSGFLCEEGGNWVLKTVGYGGSFMSDIFVNKHFVENYGLRTGDFIEGRCKRTTTTEIAGLASVLKVNGLDYDGQERLQFENLAPVYADRKLKIACGASDRTGRIIDLFAPIGAGQRALLVAPHGCGKTRMLKNIAAGIERNNRNAKLVIALIDVSPEEANDFTKSFKSASIFASPYDAGTEAHIKTMNVALEYCKRLTEQYIDSVLIIDDLTRLARAYNSYSGRVSAGLDYTAVDYVKRVLAAARNTDEGGSLTIISALNMCSGDIIEDTAYSCIKDACNVKISLSLTLARAKVYPPIVFHETYSINDERVLSEEEMQTVVKLREKERQEIFDLLDSTADNKQLIEKVLR